MKNFVIAGALFAALTVTPALADTAGPTQAEIAAATQRTDAAAPVTDAELHNYVMAQEELANVYPAPPLSAAQMTRVRAETAATLARHNLTATRYNEISTALDVNQSLATRYAAISPMRSPGV